MTLCAGRVNNSQDPTDSDKSASDRDSNLGDTTDNGNVSNCRSMAEIADSHSAARTVVLSPCVVR